MMKYDPQLPLVFLHLPKCAGTSVRRIFSKWYGDNFYRHYFDDRSGALPEKVDLGAAREKAGGGGYCIFGHFNSARGFGIDDYYPGTNQIVTIVRDPFEQHVSNYYFAKRKISEGKHDLPLAKVLLEKHLDLPEYISGVPCSYAVYFPGNISASNLQSVIRERFLFVGLTEEVDESVLRISRLLGRPHRGVGRKNVSDREARGDLGELKALFRERNPFSVEIYEECRRIFLEERKPTLGDRLTGLFRGRWK